MCSLSIIYKYIYLYAMVYVLLFGILLDANKIVCSSHRMSFFTFQLNTHYLGVQHAQIVQLDSVVLVLVLRPSNVQEESTAPPLVRIGHMVFYRMF